jgi:hypothetical protein
LRSLRATGRTRNQGTHRTVAKRPRVSGVRRSASATTRRTATSPANVVRSCVIASTSRAPLPAFRTPRRCVAPTSSRQRPARGCPRGATVLTLRIAASRWLAANSSSPPSATFRRAAEAWIRQSASPRCACFWTAAPLSASNPSTGRGWRPCRRRSPWADKCEKAPAAHIASPSRSLPQVQRKP